MGDTRKSATKKKRKSRKKKKKPKDPWMQYNNFLERVFKGEVIIVKKPLMGLADYQFRSDLRRLMGSDAIHLNDRKWNEKLQSRLREEHEKRLDRKEEQLAEAEVMRIRKLKLDGIISMTDDKNVNDNDHKTKKKVGKAKGKRRKGSQSRRKRSPSPSQQRVRCISAPSRSVTFYKPPEDIPTQVEMINKPSKTRSVEDGSENLESTSSRSRTTQDDDEVENTKSSTANHKTSSDDDPSHNRSSRKVKEKKVPEEIKELLQEETVDGLYSLAERLVITGTRPAHRSTKQDFKYTVEES